MALQQDGTELFGIPMSPVTYGASATAILEQFELSGDVNRATIQNPNGGFQGAAFDDSVDFTGTFLMQFATSTAAVPTPGGPVITVSSAVIPTEVNGGYFVTGQAITFTQGDYAKATIPVAKRKN